jgi:hypothetical protein
MGEEYFDSIKEVLSNLTHWEIIALHSYVRLLTDEHILLSTVFEIDEMSEISDLKIPAKTMMELLKTTYKSKNNDNQN